MFTMKGRTILYDLILGVFGVVLISALGRGSDGTCPSGCCGEKEQVYDQLLSICSTVKGCSLGQQNFAGVVFTSKALGYTYLIDVRTRKNWGGARAACVERGFQLASIDSHTEQTFVQHHLQSDPLLKEIPQVWVDGTDQGHEGCWVTTAPQIKKFPRYYSHWYTGQPDNYRGAEHCMELNKGWQYHWNDAPCTIPFHFVCKRKLGTIVSNMVPDSQVFKTKLCG